MNNNLSISVILPIKSAKAKDFNQYFEKAIKSLQDQKTSIDELVIVHTAEESLITLLEEYNFGSLNVVKLLWDKDPF
jgi:peptidase E